MLRTLRLSLATATSILALAAFAFAHHGSADFDASKITTITGTVIEFAFINPHALLTLEVKDPSTGKIAKWHGELTSPSSLAQLGWNKNTLKPGDEVTMTGMPLKSGAPAMAIRKLVKNGELIPVGGAGAA